jgi:hypothetical protein
LPASQTQDDVAERWNIVALSYINTLLIHNLNVIQVATI